MNVRIVLLHLIFLIHLPVDIVHSVEENCYRGDQYDYDNPCFVETGQGPEKLDNCPIGQRRVRRCEERCKLCEEGTFSDSQYNNCLNCKPCKTECPEGQVVTQECTLESDTVCACPPQPCPTIPTVSCAPCPTSPECPTLPKQTDVPVTPSEPGDLLTFTKNCPPDIEKLLDDNETNKSISWDEPEATLGSTIVHQSYKPGHNFLIGHFEAVYVFANNSGATIACSFSISVTAPVSTTGQPLCDPPEDHFIKLVIAFISGIVLTLVVLILLWGLCYCRRFLFLKKMCPHHQEKADKMREDGVHEPLVGNGPNAGGDGVNQNGCNHIPQVQENHQGAAGGLAQAEEGYKDNQDQDTEMKALNGEDKEDEPENNQQIDPSGPSDVGKINGGQQDGITLQDTTQQSPSTSNFPSQYVVALPPDSLSTPPQPLSPAGGPSLPPYDNVAPSLIKDAEVTDDDIEALAAIVADNDRYYDKKDTFIRSIITYTMKKRIEEIIDRNADRNTQLVQYLQRGWRAVASSRNRSDLAAKIKMFDPSLERDFIKRINERDEIVERDCGIDS